MKEQKNEIEKIKNYGKGEYEVNWLPTPHSSREFVGVEASNWKEAVDIVKNEEQFADNCDELLERLGYDIEELNEYYGDYETAISDNNLDCDDLYKIEVGIDDPKGYLGRFSVRELAKSK